MMNKRILVKLACMAATGLVAGCDAGTDKAATGPRETTPASMPAAAAAESMTAAATESAVPSTESMRFVLEGSDRQQSLQLGKRPDGSFDVTLALTGACSRTETGTATEVLVDGDPDVMTDPEGGGHPVDLFKFTTPGNCNVTVRLDLDKNYVWLYEGRCESACPLSEDAMTRK